MNETKYGMGHNIRQAFLVTVALLVLCGLVFPVLLSGLSALIFPSQAQGTLVMADGVAVGAKNVGQEFTEDYFMWSRPSAYHYNVYVEGADGKKTYPDGSAFPGIGSGSNNYAPTNPDLTARVEAAIADFLKKNPDVKREDIPTDLLTASGSGLDPQISPASAAIQVPRMAQASGLSEEAIQTIIDEHTSGKLFGVFGEETVNVVEVNIAIGMAMGLIKAEA